MSGTRMPAAVLFDMDGTLVDSEKVWSVGLAELAGRHGGELSGEARIAMIGTNMIDSMRILHADIGRPELNPDDSCRWLEQRIKELFAEGLIWRPGARELLAEVRAAGVPTALVTATRRHLVEVALMTIGAANFDAVVCGDEVEHTKPHPVPYLNAAALVGAEPAACVAIEDSLTGVTSARAAGCAVLAVPCEAALPPLERVTQVASLTGITLNHLRDLFAEAGAVPGTHSMA